VEEPNLLEDHRSPELLVSVVLGVLSAIFVTGLGMYALEIAGELPEDQVTGALAMTARPSEIPTSGNRWDYVAGGSPAITPAWTCEQVQLYLSIAEEGGLQVRDIVKLFHGFLGQESFAMVDCLEEAGAEPLYVAAATPRLGLLEVEDGWACAYGHLDGHFSTWKRACSDDQLRSLIALAQEEGDGRLQAAGAPDPRCPELLETLGIVEGVSLKRQVDRLQRISEGKGAEAIVFELMRCLEAGDAAPVLIAAVSTEIQVVPTATGWRCEFRFERSDFSGSSQDCTMDYMDALLQRSREQEAFARVLAERVSPLGSER